MATTITAYQASDGTKFFDAAQCERHEAELRLLAEIQIPNSKLGHGKYKQHDRVALLSIKRRLWAVILERYGDSFPEWRKWNADQVHPMSIVGRVMSDSDGPIANAWSQLSRFNFELGREYDQPYFANHPEEAEPA
jgi:hypothetical protein